MTDTEKLLQLSRSVNTCTGDCASHAVPISGSASSRQYYIIKPQGLIGTIGTNIAENRAFFHIDKIMREGHVNVPRIIAISNDGMYYLQDNVGNQSLYEIIEAEGFTPHVVSLCYKAIDQLVKFQTSGIDKVDLSKCYPMAEMTGDSVMWDLNYFKYCFLKIALAEIDETALQSDFDKMGHAISTLSPRLLLHRDFQSRNIMVKDDTVSLIDFQGARRGPALYDIVSFLWQARAGFPDKLREELLNYYLTQLSSHTAMATDEINKGLDMIIVFRMLQVLGAYGFRGLIQHKPAFVKPISRALSTLATHLKSQELPYLQSISTQLTAQFHNDNTPSPINRSLTVDVTSFSYKKGIPQDTSGNGGGYIFDCRAIHNPGRYEQYKTLTGNDPEVIKFLEDDGEILQFLDHCCALVDKTVERYLQRGFTHLSVSFGCTGGQHRSVYSANFMARHLDRKYGVTINLNHREQNTSKCL